MALRPKWLGATRTRVPVKEILNFLFKKNEILYSILAEWNSWQSWGPCSVTCDYGIRQRSRTCSIPSQCSGLGPAVDTEYCTAADCHGMAKGKKKNEKTNGTLFLIVLVFLIFQAPS